MTLLSENIWFFFSVMLFCLLGIILIRLNYRISQIKRLRQQNEELRILRKKL